MTRGSALLARLRLSFSPAFNQSACERKVRARDASSSYSVLFRVLLVEPIPRTHTSRSQDSGSYALQESLAKNGLVAAIQFASPFL